MKHASASEIARIFTCDPETGAIYRNGKRVDFKDCRYRRVIVPLQVGTSRFFAHRVVWCLVYGAWPSGPLDHKDCDGQNNSIHNLRLCTHSENLCNTKVRSDNRVGLKGVRRTPYGRYQARIRVGGSDKYLGTFDDAEQAHLAYAEAAAQQQGRFIHQSIAQVLGASE